MRLLRAAVLLLAAISALAQPPQRWPVAQATEWYAKQPWPVGSNYIPSTAINQLEMRQQETFDPVTIDRELGLAQGLGMNTMRVFLHDLLWQHDASGFEKRINVFLRICRPAQDRPVFSSCSISVWNPLSGDRPATRAQARACTIPAGCRAPAQPRSWTTGSSIRACMLYVQGIPLTDFKNDKRILAWDLWNEPENTNGTKFRGPGRAKG